MIKQDSSTMYIKLYLRMIGHTLNVVTLALQSLRIICIGGTRSSIWYIASPIIKRLFYNKNISLEKHFCFPIVWQEFSLVLQGPRIKYFNKKSKHSKHLFVYKEKSESNQLIFSFYNFLATKNLMVWLQSIPLTIKPAKRIRNFCKRSPKANYFLTRKYTIKLNSFKG